MGYYSDSGLRAFARNSS